MQDLGARYLAAKVRLTCETGAHAPADPSNARCPAFTDHGSLSLRGLPCGSREDLRQSLVAKGKGPLHLRTDQAFPEAGKSTTRQGVLDGVGNRRTLHAVAHLDTDSVPMAKLLERPSHLHIDEMAVPFEVHDPRQPTHPRNPPDRAEADQDLRSFSRGDTAKSSRRIGHRRARRRRLQPEIFDSYFLLKRRQVGKIGGICKKCKHKLHGKRHPLVSFKPLHHGPDRIAPVRKTDTSFVLADCPMVG